VAVSQRHDLDAGVIEPVVRALIGREQHRFASGQDLRPAVGEIAVFAVEFGKRSGSAAIGWNSG
jgi:hypothetical protein